MSSVVPYPYQPTIIGTVRQEHNKNRRVKIVNPNYKQDVPINHPPVESSIPGSTKTISYNPDVPIPLPKFRRRINSKYVPDVPINHPPVESSIPGSTKTPILSRTISYNPDVPIKHPPVEPSTKTPILSRRISPNPANREDNYCNTLTNAIRDNSDIFKVFMTDDDYRRFMDNYISQIREAASKFTLRFEADDFFANSYLSLLLPFLSKSKTGNNAELISNSTNASFLITEGLGKEKIYIKFVDFESQKLISGQIQYDLAIYDIMASLIFESIFEKEYYKNKRNIIPVYKGCCLSYIKEIDRRKYWDYNEIYDYCGAETTNSPYHYLNLESNSSKYNKKAILIFYEAIDNPINVYQLFKLYYHSYAITKDKQKQSSYKEMIMNVFDKYCDVFTFLIDIGTKYGFVHNDLHTNNIIYDQTTKELKIIDFGRAFFKPFDDKKINEAIRVDFDKLNYYEILTAVRDANERRLYEFHETFYENAIKSKKIESTEVWGGIVFDLITISINMYVKLLAFTYIDDKDEFDKLHKSFDTIINIRYFDDKIINLFEEDYYILYPSPYDLSGRYITDLVSKYKTIKSSFLSTISDDKRRRLYEIILEGLLYAVVVNYKFKRGYRQISFPTEDYGEYNRRIVLFRKKINDSLSKEEIEKNFKFIYKSNNYAPSTSDKAPSTGGKAPKLIKKKPVSLDDTISAYKKMFAKTKKGGYKKLLKKY